MSKELVTTDSLPVTVIVTKEQVDLIRDTICREATDQEMQLFFYDCQRRGVHPLDKLIHFTKRSNRYTPITSIDFMRSRAHSTQEFAGEDETTFDGEPGTPAFKAVHKVYRFVQGQRFGWTATARWAEYFPGEQVGFMWKKMPYLMLGKCAEALALRKAFPNELQGLYAHEEMDQAGNKQMQDDNSGHTSRYGGEMIAPPSSKNNQRQADGMGGAACTNSTENHASHDASAASPAKAFCEEQGAKAGANELTAEGYIGTYQPRLAGKTSPPGKLMLETLRGELTLQFWDKPEGLGTPNHSYARVTYRVSQRGKFTNNELLKLEWAAPPA